MQVYNLYSNMSHVKKHKTVAEISTSALAHNYRILSSLNDAKPICVVKADAYGHVADICVRTLLHLGCSFFAVSCIEEAIDVRKICESEGLKADVLILGYTSPELVCELEKYDIIQSVLSCEYAEEISHRATAENVKIRAHVKLDTGMNRIGICATAPEECEKASEEILYISKLDGIILEGMFTHFAKSDEESSVTLAPGSHTRTQGERFLCVTKKIEDRGLVLFKHACNSAASVRFPEFALDGVRLGIMLYGIYPSKYMSGLDLRPVMTLKTLVSHVHTVRKGESVGYGGAYIAERDVTVATLPIGYADGFIRDYSGAQVTVQTSSGKVKATVIGRVCMDQCMIDVTSLGVRVGDEVTLFGDDPASLSRLACLASTIEYECLCLISGRVPRIKK